MIPVLNQILSGPIINLVVDSVSVCVYVCDTVTLLCFCSYKLKTPPLMLGCCPPQPGPTPDMARAQLL